MAHEISWMGRPSSGRKTMCKKESINIVIAYAKNSKVSMHSLTNMRAMEADKFYQQRKCRKGEKEPKVLNHKGKSK